MRPVVTSAPVRLTARQRLLLGGVCGAGVAVLFLALSISPDPRGFGTHQQLGLPPCSFQVLCGYPCPSCGMTTSLAHFVRGAWGRAWETHPAACFLGLSLVLGIPGTGWCAGSGWGVRRETVQDGLLVWLGVFNVLCLGFWLVKYLLS